MDKFADEQVNRADCTFTFVQHLLRPLSQSVFLPRRTSSPSIGAHFEPTGIATLYTQECESDTAARQ
jgi:hypothetical protein